MRALRALLLVAPVLFACRSTERPPCPEPSLGASASAVTLHLEIGGVT